MWSTNCYTVLMKISTKQFNNIGKWFIVVTVIVCLGKVYVDKKIGEITVPPKGDVGMVEAGEEVDFLELPAGFKATYYAKGVDGARVMEWDSQGRMLVSQTGEGKISVLIDENGDGTVESVKTLIDNLDKPHGMTIKCNPVGNPPCHLYVAQHGELSRYAYDADKIELSQYTKLMDLPKSKTDRHYTRTLLDLSTEQENRLLISVGSSCNVCDEKDGVRGKIISYDIDTGEISDYARGLRNAAFMTRNPLDGRIFMTEMGRDGLGDDTPPDEINVIDPDKVTSVPNFGWPICYGQNIHDGDFDKKQYIRDPCEDPTPAYVDLQAHSAPLGLSFFGEESWPQEYWFDLLVAYHGSWNREVPTGYKIVRVKTDKNGESAGVEDFITGWLSPEGDKLGRPADVRVMPGTIYISDDMKGVIYKISRI